MPFTLSEINVKESTTSIYINGQLGLQTLQIKENTKSPERK